VRAATQIYYASFDAVFLKLPAAVRARIEAKIDEIGLQLNSFPHHRLKRSNRFAFTKAMQFVALLRRCASAQAFELALVTTESFTPLRWNRTGFICSPSGIAGKFTDHKPLTMRENQRPK
jgi:hypothetical protein